MGLIAKNTFLFMLLSLIACVNSNTKAARAKNSGATSQTEPTRSNLPIITGAENLQAYLPMIRGKKVGIVTNQTGTINYIQAPETSTWIRGEQMSVVDYLIGQSVQFRAIYAPEHGFRGTADAGETIRDGRDIKTGLPIISLYGNNKKPSPSQLEGIDVMLFDLQDVGARFYTYISTLHYVVEACAENNIPLIVLDRPNPNNGTVDGPVLEKGNESFVGMHPIPVLHGLTIGEYAQMVLGERWVKADGLDLTVVPCLNYEKNMRYSLPVKPSPNLPNDRSVNLYASLCLFEGTNVSVGRGTNKQFQIYGSPFLPDTGFSFVPMPNVGAKDPMHKGKKCFGKDLSAHPPVKKLELEWLIDAYANTSDKKSFFNNFFLKLAGTTTLREQIETGVPENKIRESWQPGLAKFRALRSKYLLYAD